MAKLFGGRKFNADDYGEMNSFDPIPDGPYIMEVKKSDYKENSAKTGHYASFQIEVLEGEYKGRSVFVNMNLDNPNQQAVDIAEKELAALCRACGKPSIDDTVELHGIPFKAEVRGTPARNGYPPGNKIVKYERLEGVATPSRSAAQSDGDAPPPPKKGPKKMFG